MPIKRFPVTKLVMKKTAPAPMLFAMVMAGAFCVTPASVAAKDSGGALSASSAFRDSVSRVQTSLAAGDVTGAGNALVALQGSTPIEKYMAASLRLEVASRRNDVRAQYSAIKDMLANGAVPNGQEAYLHYLAGYTAIQTGAADEGIAQLNAARAQGFDRPQLSLLLVDAYVRRNRKGEALKLLSDTIAKQVASGQAIPAAWLDRGAGIAYGQKDWSTLAAFHSRKLAFGGTAGEWRSAISAYIAGANPDKDVQLDLLRLQYATSAMASERDYHGYAALAAGLGYPAEAKTVIDAGRSNGKLLTSDPVIAPLLAQITPKARQYLSATYPVSDKSGSAASAADAGDRLLSVARYGEAAAAYRKALGMPGSGVNTDRTNLRLGIALARSGDMAGALAAFAQAKGAWSDVAAYWSAWATGHKAP